MDAHALMQHGLALQSQGRFADAAAVYDRLLAMQPGSPAALLGRGAALRGLGAVDAALADHESVLVLDPANADAWNGRGALLRNLGRRDEALDSLNQAIALRPGFAEALDNRGQLLMDRNAHEAALADFEQVRRLAPGRAMVDTHIAHLRMLVARHSCDFAGAAAVEQTLPGQVAKGENISPFLVLQYSDDEMLQLQAASNQIALCYPPEPPLHRPRAPQGGPIRLGYLSSDFRDHAVAAQVVEVLERHDRAGFVVHGLSTGSDDGSGLRARLMGAFAHFIDLHGMAPHAAARRIADLNLDILVDLNGLTQNHNFNILCQKPAPVQVEWLGYAGTSGAPYMDFIVADRIVALNTRAFAEKVAAMPRSFFPADTRRAIAPAPSRAAMGLPQDGIVFCCFNHPWKFTAPVFAVWLRLLRQLPGSLLWLRAMPDTALARLQQVATTAGVDPARLVQAPRAPLDLHLARHACADLFLDTLPYNAHATASDALYAGLPVLTCKGHSFAGRVAASLLEAAGLPELITESLEDYEARALALARAPQQLNALRRKLAQGRDGLFDMARFTRELEELYRAMVSE